MSRYAAALTRDEVPSEPFLVLGQMTTADPSRSPAGTESLWTYTHLPRRDEWTPEAVARHVARVEAVLEAHAPGFRELVLGRHVAGPAWLAAENPSLVGGALGGGTAAPHQQLVFRPVPGLGRADTPVDRLFLASSAAHPGPGVHGGPGANAARAALARDRALTGGAYAAAVAAAHRATFPPSI
jgi:phytoene dehydrogenase-like protein